MTDQSRQFGSSARRQWWTLVHAEILDGWIAGGSSTSPGYLSVRRPGVARLLLFIVLGLLTVPAVLTAPDSRGAVATIAQCLVGYIATILAPRCLRVWIPQPLPWGDWLPISVRTKCAARASVVVIAAAELALVYGSVVLVALAMRSDSSARLVAATLVTIAGSASLAVGGLIAVARPLRRLDYSRAKSLVTVVHVPVSLWAFSLPFHALYTQAIGHSGDRPAAWWTLWPLVPDVLADGLLVLWPVAIAFGGWWSGGTASAVSLTAVAIFAATLATPSLATLAAKRERADRTESISWGTAASSLHNAGRAAAVLVLCRLRLDESWRSDLLSSAALVLAFVAIDLVAGHRNGLSAGLEWSPLALVLAPSFVHRALARTTNARAVWVIETAPLSRAALISSCRDIVAVGVLGPVCLLATALLWYRMGPSVAVPGALLLCALSYVILQLTVLAEPRLPLSMAQGTWAPPGVTLSVVVQLAATVVPLQVWRSGVHSPFRAAVSLALSVAVCAVLHRVTHRKLEPRLVD